MMQPYCVPRLHGMWSLWGSLPEGMVLYHCATALVVSAAEHTQPGNSYSPAAAAPASTPLCSSCRYSARHAGSDTSDARYCQNRKADTWSSPFCKQAEKQYSKPLGHIEHSTWHATNTAHPQGPLRQQRQQSARELGKVCRSDPKTAMQHARNHTCSIVAREWVSTAVGVAQTSSITSSISESVSLGRRPPCSAASKTAKPRSG